MIVSLEREDDKQTAKDVLAILEIVVRSYERTGNTELLTHIQRLNAWYDTMVEKIKHGDYTEADARRQWVDNFMRKHYGDKS